MIFLTRSFDFFVHVTTREKSSSNFSNETVFFSFFSFLFFFFFFKEYARDRYLSLQTDQHRNNTAEGNICERLSPTCIRTTIDPEKPPPSTTIRRVPRFVSPRAHHFLSFHSFVRKTIYPRSPLRYVNIHI